MTGLHRGGLKPLGVNRSRPGALGEQFRMKRRNLLIGIGLCAIGAVVFVALRKPSDAHMSQELVGNWIAEDPVNATLHRHNEGVQREEIDVRADGTLTYRLQLAAPTTQPGATASIEKVSEWAWKVEKGRLLLRDLGEGASQSWMKPLKISVSEAWLTIDRRAYPTKEFSRLKTAGMPPPSRGA